MKKFYVVGNKTSKSLSPTIFNYWFKKYNIDAKYDFLELSIKTFDKNINAIKKEKDVFGINITIPFKQKIIKHSKTLDRHAKKIKAVNCLTFKPKNKGNNTDWMGYFNSLPKHKNLKEENIILIGYGGAALAIHYLFKQKGCKKIKIFNRTKRKIRYEKKIKYTINLNQIKKHLASATLIINTIPLNPLNKEEIELIEKKATISDIVYTPKQTEFLKKFPKNEKIYGISMLIEQAVISFELWFGFKPKVDLKLVKLLDKKIK